MIIQDSVKLYANVCIQVLDKRTMAVKRTVRAHNIVTSLGLDEIGRRMALELPIGPDQMAVGDGTTAAAVTDIALVNQLLIDTMGTESGATASTIFQYLLGGSAVDGESLTEAGIFNADDELMARVVHEAIVKGTDEAINYTWIFTFGNPSA